MGDADVWLWTLLVAAGATVVRAASRRVGWRWARGLYAQVALAAGLAGLAFLPALRPWAAWLAAAAWGLLLAPGLAYRPLAGAFRSALVTYDLARARRAYGWARRVVFHLPTARLMGAQLAAMERMLARDPAGADAALAPFLGPEVPAAFRAEALVSRLFVRHHDQDWAGLVALADGLAPGPVASMLAAQAARACLELGDAAGAAGWLGRLRAEGAAAGPNASQAVVPAYALLGAEPQLEATLRRLGPSAMPAAFVAYWRGRCLIARGDGPGGIARLREAEALLPEGAADARARMRGAIARAEDGWRPALDDPGANAAALGVAEALEARAWGVSELVSGGDAVGVTRGLALVVAVPSVFVILGLDRWVPAWERPAARVFEAAALYVPAVKAGEAWRLVSHMGLHGGWAHLGLNLAALLWLGPRVQRLFGPVALVVAFVAGGVAGGLAHVAAATAEVAIGCSGGVMALLGMLAAGWVRGRDLLPGTLRRRLLAEMGAVIAIQLVLDQLVPQVAAAAHAGGLVAGAALGWAWRMRAG